MKHFSSLTIILSLSIILALALGGGYFFLFSSLSKMRENRATFAVGIKDTGKILKQEEMNGTALSAYFVKSGNEAGFISSIESLCSTLSLTCTMTSLDESDASADSIQVFHLTVTSLGSFNNEIALLQSFEHSPYPLVIDTSNLNFQGDVTVASSSISQWQGSFNIEVPVLTSETQ